MKILHTADNHFKKNRIDEAIKCSDNIVDYLESNDVDIVAHCGDIFDKNTTVNSPEYLASLDFIYRLSKHAPVVMIRGNHDPVGSLSAFQKMDNVHVVEKPGRVTVGGIDFFTLPYVSVQEQSDDFSSIKEAFRKATLDTQALLVSYGKYESNLPRVFLGHIFVDDAVLANSETISANEVMLSLDDLRMAKCDMYLLGHIHNHEQDIFKGFPVRYCGAHYKTNFSETQEPGFFVWDTDNPKKPEFVKTNARGMHEFEMDVDDVRAFVNDRKLPFDIPGDSDVKIRMRVPQSIRAMVKRDDLLKFVPDDSTLTMSRITVPEVKLRNEKIAKLRRFSDKLVEWCSMKKIKASDGLINKAERLEGLA